ncbi:hypothetical protein HA402_010915 [Bradysia odoriphaga]|nr:hypothetical protein HA402_010915 [Bradysia odoriphaga]
MDKLDLPWHDEYWSLIITCTVSTAEIWGRLIGKEYSNALDSLVTDIELDLLKNKQVPTTFNVGQIYLTLMNECAYRIRVEKVNEAKRQCLCFGVDEGDQRWYSMDEMYVCQSKFLKLAPQAIRFALHGMEDFDENKFAKKHLEETLLSSPPLIGQIFTKAEEFMAQEAAPDVVPVIQLVLYDTSTAEDINLHQVIVNKICADIAEPELNHAELTKVNVSHISDDGDIFIQLQQNGVHYVNKLIHKLTQSDLPNRHQTLPASNTANNTLFLVFDEETHKWCRGKFINEMKELKANKMLFVDIGKTKSVPLTKIYRLESISQALLTFPPQAMQVKLKGLTEFPQHLVSTLRGYFMGDTKAYVMKMNITSSIPEVNLYYCRGSDMISVNECLKTDLQRQQSNESLYSRQSSINSNSSREPKTPDDLSHFNNLTLHGPKLPKFQPPNIGDHFDIEVVMTATPAHFMIRPIKHMRQWVQQMKSLQDYCAKSRDALTLDKVREDDAYACLHSDGKWYRAVVERHLGTKLLVSFCDLGDIDCIDDVQRLKILPKEYRDLPKLAMTARLYGIKPVNSSWEMDDTIEFNRLVSGQKFQAIVGRIIAADKVDDNAVLEIQLIDVSNEYDIVINDQLVDFGRAIRC